MDQYTALEGVVFTPRPDQIDAKVCFGILTGAALLEKGPGSGADITIDWCEVWLWEDTNNNGIADAGDLVDGRPQDWRLLLRKSGAPDVNKAIDLLPTSVELQAGKGHLLLLRVSAGGKTNLQFAGDVAVNWPDVGIIGWTDYGQEGWSSTGEGKFTANWSPAVESREVLRLRVNNPPALPVVPKSHQDPA